WRDCNSIALNSIEVTGDLNLIFARQQFHFFHRRLDTNSFRRHFHRIDAIIELDANRRFFESVIECRDPFYLERLSLPDRDYLQIGKRPPAFRLDEAVYDEIKRASKRKRRARSDPERCRLDAETFPGFLFVP